MNKLAQIIVDDLLCHRDDWLELSDGYHVDIDIDYEEMVKIVNETLTESFNRIIESIE